ncbi:MAG TPA: replication protein [Gemmataceae bacterium]|jgi:DNA-binding transcriptional ArsR family regulator
MPRALIPNSTQIPDLILDHWMAELSGAEFKVLMYIARRTYGFGKESDTISLSQIAGGLTRRDGRVLDRGTGASRSSVARSLKELEERGLVIRTMNLAQSGREFEENTYRINLDWEPPNEPSGGQPSGGEEGRTGVVSKSDHLGSGRDHLVSKCEEEWSRNRTTVVSKLDIQETVLQETVLQETAAAGEPDAAADLVEVLVKEGVGRTVAVRLANAKPELCRRYLEWLPFADVRTTRGTWLANAIEHEFGPPKRLTARRAATRSERSDRHTIPDRTNQDGRGEDFVARWRVAYAHLEKNQPDAITAFRAYFAAEQEKAGRFAETLSEKGKRAFFEQADSEEFRLTAFERWMKADGKKFSAALPRDRMRDASATLTVAHVSPQAPAG